RISFAPGVDPALATLLFDPQTSGGLLAAGPEADLPRLLEESGRQGAGFAVIGRVTAGEGIRVVP
ncbi:MAG: selenide, water dikinase SelD, partial [Chloroflexota bacterium]